LRASQRGARTAERQAGNAVRSATVAQRAFEILARFILL
jgi:hypothetical protein